MDYSPVDCKDTTEQLSHTYTFVCVCVYIYVYIYITILNTLYIYQNSKCVVIIVSKGSLVYLSFYLNTPDLAYGSSVQSCTTLWDPVDCSFPGSVHGLSQPEYWSGLPFPSPDYLQ